MENTKLINELDIQRSTEQQVNEQFINDYIYKLSLFNPELYSKINNLCSLTYLMGLQLKLSSNFIKDLYWYSSLYYIKDSKVIQIKMASHCKKFNNIKRIKSTGISYYNQDLIELIIMLCDEFLNLYGTKNYNECIYILQQNEIIPQILVKQLIKINTDVLERSLKWTN